MHGLTTYQTLQLSIHIVVFQVDGRISIETFGGKMSCLDRENILDAKNQVCMKCGEHGSTSSWSTLADILCIMIVLLSL